MTGVSGIAVPAAMIAVVGTLQVSALPSGAAIPIAATSATALLTCAGNPIGYWNASGNWGDAADTLNQKYQTLASQVGVVKNAWSGDSMQAFVDYWDQYVDPLFKAYVELMKANRGLFLALGFAMSTFLLAIITATVAAITAMVSVATAAAASTVAAPVVIQGQWLVAAAWIALAVSMVGGLITFFAGVMPNLNTVKDQLVIIEGKAATVAGRDPLAAPTMSHLDNISTLEQAIEEWEVK